MSNPSFNGTFTVSGSIPQDTASWTLTLTLTQSGTELSGTLERREDGYNPDIGTQSRVTHSCPVSGTVDGDHAELSVGPPLSLRGSFRRTAAGIEPVNFSFYHGGTDRCWRAC